MPPPLVNATDVADLAGGVIIVGGTEETVDDGKVCQISLFSNFQLTSQVRSYANLLGGFDPQKSK